MIQVTPLRVAIIKELGELATIKVTKIGYVMKKGKSTLSAIDLTEPEKKNWKEVGELLQENPEAVLRLLIRKQKNKRA